MKGVCERRKISTQPPTCKTTKKVSGRYSR